LAFDVQNQMRAGRPPPGDVSLGDTQARKSILIVDDDLEFSRALKRILAKSGFEVALAAEGAEGLAVLEAGHFDLVITDLEMGPVSGLDLISAVRSRGIPVKLIVLTAFGGEESAREAERAGADAFLGKPVRRDVILECISQVFPREQTRDSRLEVSVNPGD
jgi:DNA-binding NtrC family response regulator